MTAWATTDIPDLLGRRAVVTGATSGLGEQVVLALAQGGADVILAARNPDKLERTVRQVIRAAPLVKVEGVRCDLADLESVRAAADRIRALGPLSILVNNAGVMAPPLSLTRDGFESQFGTNHLGHFALTGLLWETLVDSGRGRVVTVSSIMARFATTAPLGDPRARPRRYRRWQAYAGSKLANLLFTFELDRFARRAGAPVVSVAAHPGYTRTALQREVGLVDAVSDLVGQPAAVGALPLLRAATDPSIRGGAYLGPGGPLGLRGAPILVDPPPAALRTEDAERLWRLSEQATGVRYR